VTYSGTAP
jgi:hypothetical protein